MLYAKQPALTPFSHEMEPADLRTNSSNLLLSLLARVWPTLILRGIVNRLIDSRIMTPSRSKCSRLTISS